MASDLRKPLLEPPKRPQDSFDLARRQLRDGPGASRSDQEVGRLGLTVGATNRAGSISTSRLGDLDNGGVTRPLVAPKPVEGAFGFPTLRLPGKVIPAVPSSVPPAIAGGPGGGSSGDGSAAAIGLAKKKRAQGVRSWIRIDQSGEVSTMEVDKGTIMRRCDLPARDLRLLDPVFVYPSTILGREHAIVVNLEKIRCIITAEEVLLLNTPDPAVVQFKNGLQRRLLLGVNAPDTRVAWQTERMPVEEGVSASEEQQLTSIRRREVFSEDMFSGSGHTQEEDDLPFEFKALELALEISTSALDLQAQQLAREAYPLLEKLAFHISTTNLELVRRTKSSLLGLTRRVQKVRDEIEQLMDDDGDMAEMYLTEKRLREIAAAAAAEGSEHSGSRATGRHMMDGHMMMEGMEDSVHRSSSVGGFGSSISAPVSPVGSPRQSGALFGDRRSGIGGGPGLAASVAHSYSEASSAVDDVESLEMLLEAYFVVVDGTLNKLTQLSQYIDDTEDFINIQLDNVRNQLIQFELIMTTAGFVVALWGVVAGTFGMNVPLGVEDDPYALKWIIMDTGFGGFAIFAAFLLFFRYKNWTF